jgi:hypothetical protein
VKVDFYWIACEIVLSLSLLELFIVATFKSVMNERIHELEQ